MFIDRMLNQTNAPLLEKMLQFTSARAGLLAEDVVNISTPNYHQKDLSLEGFQEMLGQRVEQRRSGPPGSPVFEDMSEEVEFPKTGILFHDGSNKSMEQLMSAQAKNAMMHNMAIELLRKQFQTMEMALKEKIG